MVLFEYATIDKGKGIIEASSLEEAKNRLREEGLLVTRLTQAKRAQRQKLRGDHLINFTLQLSQLVRSGLPLFESLSALEEQHRGEKFQPLLAQLCESLKRGEALSYALSCYPDSFDRLYCAMIASGEAAGTLDNALQKLAALLTKQGKMRKSLFTAMVYPAVIASFCLAVICLLLTFAIPSIEELFEGQQINGFTSAVLGISHFLTHYPLLYLPLLGAAALLVFKKRGALLHLPILKRVAVEASVARFARTLATLLEGGVSLVEALQISKGVMLMPELEATIAHAQQQVVEGRELSQLFKEEPLFPPLLSRMLAIGEEGGEMAPMLQRIADFYEEELEKQLSRLVALAQPAILLILGGIVGLIMLAVLLPLTNVNSFF